MASCLTFQTVYAFATSATTTKTAYQLPVLTATTTPNTCSLVVLTGTDYATNQASTLANTNKDVTQDSSINALNTAVNTLSGNATNLQTTVTTLQTSSGALQPQIDALKTVDTTQNTSIGVLNSAVSGLNAQTATQAMNAFSQVFTLPQTADASMAWSVGFVVPMSIALVAWGVKSLVNFWNER